MKNYTSNIPFVRIESQKARTGESYNATVNNNIMYGTTIIEGESDYVIVTSMPQKYVQDSEYSIIFDEYDIEYDLDLLSIYNSLPDCHIKNYKKDKILAILNDMMEYSIYINRDIREDYKNDCFNIFLLKKMNPLDSYIYKVKFTPPFNPNGRQEQARAFIMWYNNIKNNLTNLSLVDGYSCGFYDNVLVFGTDDQSIYSKLLSIDGA